MQAVQVLDAMLFLSTPSARRATTIDTIDILDCNGDFYPRPPRGGRPGMIIKTGEIMRFLSTPSARRATSHKMRFGQKK